MQENQDQTKLLEDLSQRVTEMAEKMEKTHIAEYVQLLGSPRRIIIPSLIGGISRGIGIAIGVTVFTSTILYLLKALGALNLPIVGDYIADIVAHVQNQLEGRGY